MLEKWFLILFIVSMSSAITAFFTDDEEWTGFAFSSVMSGVLYLFF